MTLTFNLDLRNSQNTKHAILAPKRYIIPIHTVYVIKYNYNIYMILFFI